METNIFELINSDFFKPLVGKNKEVNFDLLMEINQRMNAGSWQLNYDELVEAISDYFLGREDVLYDDEDDGKRLDRRNAPATKIRYFVECGWLSYEIHNFIRYYQMEPVAISFLAAMSEAIDNSRRPIESTGFVYSIFNNLKALSDKGNLNRSTAIAQQLQRDSRALNNNLRTVNSQIKKYLTSLLDDRDQKPDKILQELLSQYQKDVVSRSFQNLRSKDNPSRYSDQILDSIKAIEKEMMPELITNYCETKYKDSEDEENIREAQAFFYDVFSEIKEQFKNIEKRISTLDEKNVNYVSTARSRMMFLLNDNEDIEGKIDALLKTMEDHAGDDDEEFDIDLYELGKIDDTSPYTYVKTKKHEDVVFENEDVGNAEEFEKLLNQQIHRLSNFTIMGVNQFIVNKLGDNNEIKASEISIKSIDEWTMLFLAIMYSQSDNITYKISFLKDKFSFEDRELDDFIITRRAK